MSQIIKPVMLDETGQAANQRLDDLGSKINEHKNATSQGLSTLGDKIDSQSAASSQSLATLGGKIDSQSAASSQSLATLGGKVDNLSTRMQNIADAIESVHSVNGMTGDVVIDSTTIKTNKLDPNSKSIAQFLSEEQSAVDTEMATLQEAIGRTPLTFAAEQIEDDDYLLTFTVGAP